MYNNYVILLYVMLAAFNIDFSLQYCQKEVSTKGIPVTWHESKPDTTVVLEPLCYYKGHLVTRYCNSSGWSPSALDLQPCYKVAKALDLSSCPPGYEQVTKPNNRYCYQIGEMSTWNYPCLKNGGASIVTDLTTEEFDSLLQSLRKLNTSEYFWLPAQRRKAFGPVIWSIPGPNWGQILESAELMLFSSLIRNCLVFNTNKGIITTESCNKLFPSLCIYLEDMEYSAKCPSGYHEFRFISDNGTCFGIEHTEDSNGLTFHNFTNSKCKSPLGNSMYSDLTKFIFMKIVEMDDLPNNTWCFFQTNETIFDIKNTISTNLTVHDSLVIINNNGTIGLINPSVSLHCMACETQILYNGDTALDLEFNVDDLKLYLTIYFPSGLWKYDNDDIGVQCFSDALGFFTTVNIQFIPLIETGALLHTEYINSTLVEKSIYGVDPITNRSAQYWCEAHNKSFSLLSSSKIIVNPKNNQFHVFSLVTKIHLYDNETVPQLDTIAANLTEYLSAEKVIVMDILEYHVDYLSVLFHLHASVSENFDNKPSNLQATYETLKNDLLSYLFLQGYTFVNFSSSQYCFPTISYDYILLEWELTPIGQVAAPKQFCLQSNGLPVKRHCIGSYLLGGRWEEVEGNCNEAYEPSSTTTFLYNFVKGHISENYTSRFLIDGLGFVLDDVNIIIPADIYYLSMSFQTILDMAQINDTSVDLGDVENLAWAMDRILLMDIDYLRLSQTFNSTNVILDSVSGIFEKLANISAISHETLLEKVYQLSIKPKFIVQISYPIYNNITGIAVSKRTDSDNFTDMIIQPLYANSTIDSVISIENLEVATWVPSIVLKTVKRLSDDSDDEIHEGNVHIVINIYHNDVIFPELDEPRHVINSRIVGLTIPGYQTNLVNSIPLLFKELQQVNSKQRCGFWNYQPKREGSNPGFWSNRGCFYEKSFNNVTVCRCYHMTHFGQLLDINELRQPGENNRKKCHIRALNIITLVGSFLSLFGITGIWITAMVFQTWRKKPSTKVLIQLSTAVALPLVLMIVFNLDNTIFYEKDGKYVVREGKKLVCIFLGSLLHYSILTSFTWMLITAILQFIRYVRVLGVSRPSRFMFKFTLIGWGFPIIPVVLVLGINYETYIPDPTTDKSICYPSGIYLIMGIILPVSIVLIVNIVLFLLVLISISHGPEGKMKTSDMDLIKTQLRLSLFLFFLLGLTWIFGLFSFSNNLLWSYLFCLTSTLQGFVLFLYFVICDPATRNLWVTLLKPQSLTSSRKSISSISSS